MAIPKAERPVPEATPVTEHQLIRHVKVGDTIHGVYLVETVFIRKTKQNRDYTEMLLRDESGNAFVKYWGVLEDVIKGCFVLIEANAEDYQGTLSIIAQRVKKLDEAPDLSNYLPVTETAMEDIRAFDVVRESVQKLGSKAGDKTCNLLLDEVFASPSFLDKYLKAPGSTMPHYGKQGGLLLQAVRVARMVEAIASSSTILTDKELAIGLTAALLHRLGAVDVYAFDNYLPVETTSGALLGVEARTIDRLMANFRKLSGGGKDKNPEVQKDTLIRIAHAIVAYRGEHIQPMTKEAIVLAQASRADAELVEAADFIAQDANTTEFTAYDPVLKRKYFRG